MNQNYFAHDEKVSFLLIVVHSSLLITYFQGVGIGTANPKQCSILDVQSAIKVELLSRITLAQRKAQFAFMEHFKKRKHQY